MFNYTSELKSSLLSVCTVRMLKTHGLAYVLIMMDYANYYQDCIKIIRMHSPGEDEYYGFDEANLTELDFVEVRDGIPEIPLPKTDYKTLNQLTKTIFNLRILEKQLRRNNDTARLNDVVAEIDKINAYLEDSTNVMGITTFCTEQRIKDYHTVEKNVRNFLLCVKKIDEPLYWQLKAHIKLGYQCAWVED